MFIKDDNQETCTVTIRNVPVKMKKLFESLSLSLSLSLSPTNDFNMLYGDKRNLRKANLFTHMTLAQFLEARGKESLMRQGVELDSSTVAKNSRFKDVFPELDMK